MTLFFHNFEIGASLFENVCVELTVGSKLSQQQSRGEESAQLDTSAPQTSSDPTLPRT